MECLLVSLALVILAFALGYYVRQSEDTPLIGKLPADALFARVLRVHFSLDAMGTSQDTIATKGRLILAFYQFQIELLDNFAYFGRPIPLSKTFHKIIPYTNILSYSFEEKLGEIKSVSIFYRQANRLYRLRIENSAFGDKSDIVEVLRMLTLVTELRFIDKSPLIRHGLSRVYPAQQRITGDWELSDMQMLYLTPDYLFIISQDDAIEQNLPTKAISEIEAFPRMDDEATGILRFHVDGEQFAFSLVDYAGWAEDLAEVASKAQEQPIEAGFPELKKKSDD